MRVTENDAQRPKFAITVYGASAGTGKTYAVANEVANAIKGGGRFSSPIPPERIIATTFTNKAADELLQRVRELVGEQVGRHATAGVMGGYFGTVNAVCASLVKDFAIYAGFGPSMDVLSEEIVPQIFQRSIAASVQEHGQTLQRVAERMSIQDWRNEILEIAQLARQNGLGPDQLLACAERSWSTLNPMLDAPNELSDVLDQNLQSSVEQAVVALSKSADDTDRTAEAQRLLRDMRIAPPAVRTLTWNDWARLARMKAGKKVDHCLDSIRAAAARHSSHPMLHADLRTMVFGAFECAAKAMEEYRSYKARYGLIDFIDQEHLFLEMLSLSEVSRRIADRFSLLIVDEFQDTSPIQLAIFLELSKLLPYAVWVGDEKQAIFGFRGCDPELMQDVSKEVVVGTGGERITQSVNYRSRPELVEFVESAFRKPLQKFSLSADQSPIGANRAKSQDQAEAISIWWLPPGKSSDALMPLAQRIALVLQNPDSCLIEDRKSRQLRSIRPSDIAVLCRSNQCRYDIAQALTGCNVPVATERQHLLEAPEVAFAISALRCLVDPSDTVALAECIHARTGNFTWFEQWLGDNEAAASCHWPEYQLLVDERDRLNILTPRETVERVLVLGGVIEFAKHLGATQAKMQNLDALRGLARSYEEKCRITRAATSPAGLVNFLLNESTEAMRPGAAPEEAVQVLTYHKSKGLEWPMTILLQLDDSGKSDPFGLVACEPDSGTNPWAPLEGRWLRYWPWPYGRMFRTISLNERARQSPYGRRSYRKAAAEQLRLLYVGLTRARDYLVLAAAPTTGGTDWLAILSDENENRILHLPHTSGKHAILSDQDEVRAHFEILEPATGKEANPSRISAYSAQTIAGKIPQLPYRLTPSEHARFRSEDAQGLGTIVQVLTIGDRLEFQIGQDVERFGTLIHQFLAVDRTSKPHDERIFIAETILLRHGVPNEGAALMLMASDRLFEFVNSQFPGAIMHREYPVVGRVGLQRVNGTLDLLIDRPMSDFELVDHKSFPGTKSEALCEVLKYRTQLLLYKHLIEAASTRRVGSSWIHLPVLGLMVEISLNTEISS